MKKVAIFVVGNRNSGKSTTIRALTGCGDDSHLWNVRSNSGEILRAFVFHRAIQEYGPGRYPPANFLECLEHENRVERSDYNIFIGALELIAWRRYWPEEYIRSMTSKGFDVKVALVVTYWRPPDQKNEWPTEPPLQETHHRLGQLREFLEVRGSRPININTADDPNATGGRIRRAFYP